MFQTAGSFPVTDLANSDGQFFSAGFGSGVVDSPSPPPLFAEEDGDTFIATLRDWHLLRKKPPEDDPAAAEPPLTDEPSEPPPVSPPQQVFRLNRSGLQHRGYGWKRHRCAGIWRCVAGRGGSVGVLNDSLCSKYGLPSMVMAPITFCCSGVAWQGGSVLTGLEAAARDAANDISVAGAALQKGASAFWAMETGCATSGDAAHETPRSCASVVHPSARKSSFGS